MFNGVCDKGCRPGWKGNYCQSVSVQDDGNTSTNLSVIGIAALSVAILSIMINAVQLLYKLLLRRQKKKRNRNKTCEHSKNEHVFTPDISGYDSLVISRPEDNYQELNTVTADR